jgi:hypothetical protein
MTFLFFASLILAALFVGALVDYCAYQRRLRWLSARRAHFDEGFDY